MPRGIQDFKISLGALVLSGAILFVTLTPIASANSKPGSAQDPLVTKSYVDGYLNKLFGDLERKIAQSEAKFQEVEKSSLKIQERLAPFTDVKNHWALESIVFLRAKGIVGGFADGTFKPAGEVTRAQLASMLVRAKGLKVVEEDPDFKDVTASHWARKDIATAKKAGIIGGYSDGTFKPNQPVTRQEIAAMIARAYTVSKLKTGQRFEDANSSWAKEAINQLIDGGVLGGYPDNTFKPSRALTRAEVSVILARAVDPLRRVK